MPNIRKITDVTTNNPRKPVAKDTNMTQNGKKRGRPVGSTNKTHTVYVHSYTDNKTGEVMLIRTSVPNAEIFGPHGERSTIVRHEREIVK